MNCGESCGTSRHASRASSGTKRIEGGRLDSTAPGASGRSVSGKTERLLLNWQLTGFPLTVIPVEERARYLGTLDQGYAGQRLDWQILVAGAVERSLDLAGGYHPEISRLRLDSGRLFSE